MNHTSGPWHIALPGGPQGPFYGLVNSQGHVVATQIVGEANARLIAATPDLLTIANDLYPLFLNGTLYTDHDRGTELLGQLRQAIAKAEGREP